VQVSSETPTERQPTDVRQAYEQMMRGQVAPALRDLGLTGTLRIFRYVADGRSGEIRWQKDGRQTRRQILPFTMNLDWLCGAGRVSELMPVPATDTWWEVRGGHPTDAVADSVVSAVRCYVLSAILAGLDDPEPLQDSYSGFAGMFRPGTGGGPDQPDGGGADPQAWFVQPAGTAADAYFGDLTSPDEGARARGAEYITEWASDDARTVPALLDRLEKDPRQSVRMEVASRMLTPLADQPQVREALRRTAADDADPVVRWAAPYALRLDLNREPGREALARWPRQGGIRLPALSDNLA
jgi:hypothetical protein